MSRFPYLLFGLGLDKLPGRYPRLHRLLVDILRSLYASPCSNITVVPPAIRDPQKVSMSKTLSSLIQEGHPLISIQTVDEPRAESIARDASFALDRNVLI